MTDIQCPQCGHLALSVATRCPRCGHEFASELLQPLPPMPRRPWLRPALGLAGAVVIALGLSRLATGGRSAPTAESAPAAPLATPSGDTTPPAPVAVSPVGSASAATRVPAPDARSRGSTLPAAEPPGAPPVIRRYASDWVNVRPRRGMGGAPVLVLKPGDSVLVDSLVRGWYRVLKNGRAVGYAHRRLLTASPAGARAP